MEHNHIEWPTGRLDEKGKELSWSLNNISHNPERKKQIQTEIGLIAFEMWFRYHGGDFVFIDESIDKEPQP